MCQNYRGIFLLYVPVALADLLELHRDEAGKQRPHAATADEGLCHTSQPNVNIVRGTVELQQPAGQVRIIHDTGEFRLVLGLRQAADLAPGIVTYTSGERVQLRKRWQFWKKRPESVIIKRGGGGLYQANRGHAPFAC